MREAFIKYILSNHILVAIIVVALGWFLLEIKGILIELFIAYIIMAALTPFIEYLKKYKAPNALATTITYIVTLLIFVVIIFPLIPFFSLQIQSLFKSFPLYISQTAHIIGFQFDVKQFQGVVTSGLGTISENAFTITKNIFNGVFSILAVIVISIYLALDRKGVNAWVISLFPKYTHENVQKLLFEIEHKLGAWVRGQIVLSFSIGLVTWLALTLLGIPFALPLAMIAGILEIVPTLGPIISAIPAMIVAFTISPTLMVVVALVYAGIQFLENHILVPKIMQAAVGLNPVIIILAVATGANLLGIVGALLAIPFLSLLVLLAKALYVKPLA